MTGGILEKSFYHERENEMNKNDICFTSATDLARLIKKREISPEMNAYWRAIIRLAAAGLAAALLVYATVYWAFSDGDSKWGQGAVAPGKRVQSVAAVAEGKLYVFVGFRNEQLEPSSKTYVYTRRVRTYC